MTNEEKTEIEDTHIKPMEKCMASELGCIIKNSILSLPINSRVAIVLREFEGTTTERQYEKKKGFSDRLKRFTDDLKKNFM